MSYLSLSFLFFMIVVFVSTCLTNDKNIALRNLLLLLLSCIFYMWWDMRMLLLLLGGATIDFVIARAMDSADSQRRKRLLLILGISIPLLALVVFKYNNFFAQSLINGLLLAGVRLDIPSFKIILPIGISFYTLLRVGYLFNVYRKITVAEQSLISYLTFCTFFPTILAGPIERSTTLLPQINQKSNFDDTSIKDGCRLFLWGAFKKFIIADSLATIIGLVFESPDRFSGCELAAGLILFSIQIYSDFSGYSEMAMGIAQVLGFRLTRNFKNPYFSRNIAEFWRRWHISLSSWLRDYIFFPLGAAYRGKVRWIINIMTTFLLCGLWHGANWTFIVWGGLIGLYFVPLIFFPPPLKRSMTVAKRRWFPTWWELSGMIITFGCVTISWVFFRAESMASALNYLRSLIGNSWNVAPQFSALFAASDPPIRIIAIAVAIIAVFTLEWIQRHRKHALEIAHWGDAKRWFLYCVIVLYFIGFSGGESVGFIYADF